MKLFVPSFINDFPHRKIFLSFALICFLYCLLGLIHGLINKPHCCFITIHHSQDFHKRLAKKYDLLFLFPKCFLIDFINNVFSISLLAPLRCIPLITREHLPQVGLLLNQGLQCKEICCKSCDSWPDKLFSTSAFSHKGQNP